MSNLDMRQDLTFHLNDDRLRPDRGVAEAQCAAVLSSIHALHVTDAGTYEANNVVKSILKYTMPVLNI